MQDYWRFYLATVAFIIFFGGLLAPVLEVKLGVGGASGSAVIDNTARNLHAVLLCNRVPAQHQLNCVWSLSTCTSQKQQAVMVHCCF